MSSYYNRVIGTLSPTEIARSEDIHLIQSNIQRAFQEMMTDIFGTGCILGDEEESIKLVPTPYTIDQSNTNYNEENPWISFFDIYLRQKIDIKKSEIHAIAVTIKNTTNLMPTVFAEIRDSDFNLVKETNLKLPITDESGEKIEFSFNLQHLPIGEYYFVIRPVDINTADLTANGDETQYDTITEDNFQILCDRNGNYLQGLDASYNGVDYLESRLLESELRTFTSDGLIETEDENFDLCFEHIFSSGNTYVIENIAPCIVLGEKIYPIDTHITINGPSPTGDRIDLVSLTTDGQVNVIEGIPFTGEKTEDKYPTYNTGFTLAYITTYLESDEEWTCSYCHTQNNGNLSICSNCGATTNVKPPLIEQNDDNGLTRRRDVLERLRRLEKKMDYQTEYNSPTRIKYNCTIDPVINDASYNVNVTQNENGENIITADQDKKTINFLWSIADATYTYDTNSSTRVTLSCKDVHIAKTKPKKIDKNKDYIHIIAKDNSSKPKIIQMNLKIKINQKNTKTNKTTTVVKSFTKPINSEGNVYIDPWSFKLKEGTYNVIITYGSKSITVTLQIHKDGTKKTITPKNHSMNVNVLDGTLKENKINFNSSTFTGDDSFYKDNITVDTDAGEVYLKKTNTKNGTATIFPSASLKDLTTSNHTYKINTNTKSLQSEYPMLNITLTRDCYLNDITFKVQKTKNIKHIKAYLFHNDMIFNLNTSRKSYRKYLKSVYAEDTAFPNEKVSKEITVQDGKGFTYKIPVNKKIKKGTYSLVLIGFLKDKKQDGHIQIKEYHTSNATKYGVISTVKGTSSPNQIFMQGESLTNRTMYIKFNKIDDIHNTTGTLISKTLNTADNIISCKLSHYYDIPNGCYIHTYVSNNGGKTYVEQINNKGAVKFNTTGHELKWKLVFTGTGAKTPKLYLNKNTKYAFKASVTTGKTILEYEDYDRCFATPILNANSISRLLIRNDNIKNAFSEWEYARVWMEDDFDVTDIDICFSYAYDDYSTSVGTKMENWSKNGIFFSQIFSSLKPSDFSHTSVDYDNYSADIEDDELNFRFNLQTDYMYNLTKIGKNIATPDAVLKDENDYSYGDISNEGTDMSMFSYGLMDIETIYDDSDESNNDISLLFGPYYQAMYNPETETIWASDSDTNFHDGCIIGVAFEHGIEIEEKYTNMRINIFPNLRDCNEEDNEVGKLQIVEGHIERSGQTDDTKYYNINDEAYIPANTLELVVSFNQYGLVEENNATYGKVIPINKDLISCRFQHFDFDLSDFYGTTIYSIGLRVSKNAKWRDEDEDGVIVTKHPSLHKGDILGLGSISLGGYNIKPYLPLLESDTSARRWKWEKDTDWEESSVYVQSKLSGTSKMYAQTLLVGPTQNNRVYNREPGSTWIQTNQYNVSSSKINQNNIITTLSNGNKYSNVKYTSNEIVFDIHDQGYVFKIATDFNLTPYDYVCVQYYVQQDQTGHGNDGKINKGDITLSLYDVDIDDVEKSDAIEELVLPAWGEVQNSTTYAQQPDKTVNAWFKIHTKSKYMKAIRLYRNNPVGNNTAPIILHIKNIIFYNASELPTLGPQMHIRFYPKNMNGYYNTKIRKYGGIYRLK